MPNLTFSAVCEFLKGEDEPDAKLINAADSLLGAILVLGPTVAGLPPDTVTAVLGLLTAKNELSKIGKMLFKHFTKRDADTPNRHDKMATAFCLSCYAAFFESFSKLAPEVSKIVDLPQSARLRIVQAAVDAQNAEACSTDDLLPDPQMSIDLPHPAETLEQLTSRLLPLYTQLAKGALKLLEAFQAWDDMKQEERKGLIARFEQLPKAAAERFRAQYFELAVRFTEFAVWSNLREHVSTQKQLDTLSKTAQRHFASIVNDQATIDLGLRDLRRKVEAIPNAIATFQAEAAWKDLGRHYTNAVRQPILKDPAPQEVGKLALTYPSRSDMFIPQSFKAIRYSHGMHLETESTWNAAQARKDLGDFLLSYLSSPYSSLAPLIILGHPGSGKSLLSQMLAAQTMSDAYAPIRVELRSINADDEIEAQIEEQIRKDIARSVSFSSLMDSLKGRPAIAIFDGYDELLQATGQVFAGYLTKIQKFQEREAQALERNPIRAVVTSRITLIDKAVIPEGSTVLRLLEFDASQQSKWISVWNRANTSFFTSLKIKPFAIPNAPKIAPIAEQPLLLLMLALYDSTANQLSRATTLDQTALYSSLLRRFIERERGKEDEFKDLKDNKLRELEIDREMQRLGVAAVGMFNRHALHIRATQLNGDLEFFGLAREVPTSLGRQLSQAELVLGSFFFVHQSTAQQRGEAGDEREADAAFEFLHNTFGEFLTGHFLVAEILRHTNTLLKLRTDPELVPHRIKMLKDKDGFPPSWYSSLMHAALFYRPMIVSMITEWVKHAVKNGHRQFVDVLADFDDILFYELQRVTSGREFPSVMVERQTSFESLPLLGCLANYTLNLITLRVAISDNDFIFDERRFGSADRRPRVWDRLAHLWRSWFSPDALNALSSIFTAQRDGDTVVLQRSTVPCPPVTGGRIETITNVALAVGDDAELALVGALTHDPLKRAPITLERARHAATREELGIENEFLLRELWVSARSRGDFNTRLELYERCVKAIDKNRDLDLGMSADLIRAFGLIGAPALHRELVFRTLHLLRFPGVAIGNPEAIRKCAVLFDVLVNIDERVLPILHRLSMPDELESEKKLELAQELSANGVITLLLRTLSRDPRSASLIGDMLAECSRDEMYVSSVYPRLALLLLRRTASSRLQRKNEIAFNLLNYFVREDQLVNMPAEAAIGMLEIVQRRQFRPLLDRFCSTFLEDMMNHADFWLNYARYEISYYNMTWTDENVVVSILEVFSKCGDSGEKGRIYRFALEFWLHPGWPRILAAVVRFARAFDDGALLLEYVVTGSRSVFNESLRRTGRIGFANAITESAFRRLPIDAIRDMAWLAEKLGDRQSLGRLSALVKMIFDTNRVVDGRFKRSGSEFDEGMIE